MSLSLIADLASVVGLLISLGGFGVTIRNVGKARRAAEEARRAAQEAVSRVGERLLDDELAVLIQFSTEIEVACRGEEWSVALLRSADIRSRLARVANHRVLTKSERDDLRLPLEGLPAFRQSLERVRSSTIKRLPRSHLEILHGLIIRLEQIRSRVQAGILEL